MVYFCLCVRLSEICCRSLVDTCVTTAAAQGREKAKEADEEVNRVGVTAA